MNDSCKVERCEREDESILKLGFASFEFKQENKSNCYLIRKQNGGG